MTEPGYRVASAIQTRSMAPHFFLKTLGLPELRGPDGRVIRFRVRKHLALLVYLAVERHRAHERGRLVEIFWPHHSSRQGRHSFATALSLLRSVFGRGAFPAGRPAVRLVADNLVVDVERLEAGAIFGEDGEPDLEVDGFLRGFDVEESPEFGLWKEREHARRLPAIHAGLLTLIDHGRRRGSHDEIMRQADRLLAIDHLAEEGVRARMEAFALVGDRFSALRVFDEWRQELEAELGAEPSMSLQSMAAQLRKRGWEPKARSLRPAVPAEQWRHRRFVGRTAEFRQLYERWEEVHQSRPQHVIVSGDSGVGKTTLVQRLITAAGLEGASVARVQCFQLEQKMPFAATAGLVSALLSRPGVAATSPAALAELAKIVPQIRAHFPNLPAPKDVEGEAARLVLAEALIDLLKALMDERPLLVFIDDYHHADEASLAVWHYCARRIGAGRMMAVVSVNTAVTPDPANISDAIGDYSDRPRRIVLTPMGISESRELLEVILDDGGAMPSESEKRALVRAAAGYPMALELIVNDWRVHGAACLAISFIAMTPQFIGGDHHNIGTYGPLVQRLLPELSHPARHTIFFASLLGTRLNELHWYSLLDLSTRDAAEGIAELLKRRLLRDVGSGLEFINEMVRVCVYGAIPQPIRSGMHRRIAELLIAADPASGSSSNDLEIAWHLVRSHQQQRALPYLLSGVRQALVHGAPDQAVLAIGSSLNQLGGLDRAEAGILLAEAHSELGRWNDALVALDAYCRDGHGHLAAEAMPLQIEAQIALRLLDSAASAEAVHTLLSLRRRGDSNQVLPRASLLAARVCAQLRDYRLLQDFLRKVSVPPTTFTQWEMAVVQTARAMVLYHLRRLREATECAREAAEIVSSIGARDRIAAQVHIGLGAIGAALGDYKTATEHAVAALDIAEHLDNGPLGRLAAGNAAVLLCRVGDYRRAIEMSARFDFDPSDPWSAGGTEAALYSRCLSLVQLGRPIEALTEWSRASSRLEPSYWPWLAQVATLHHADLLWGCGRRKQAVAVARRGVSDEWSSPLSRNVWGAFARWSGKVIQHENDMNRESCQAIFSNRIDAEALDRLEILLAEIGRARVPSDDVLGERDELLGRLPSSCIEQLRTIGAF